MTVLSLTLTSIQAKQAMAFSARQNQTLGYPNSQMPCEHYPYNVNGQCPNFDWGPTHTEIYDHPSEYSSRGYTYRNCTDYVAWKLGTKGVRVPKILGNAADWYGHVAAKQRLPRARAGSVAVRMGGYGHVAFVETVHSTSSQPANDVITISEYNFYGLGTGSIRTGTVSELGFTGFIGFGVQPAKPAAKPNPKTTLIVAAEKQPAATTVTPKPSPAASEPNDQKPPNTTNTPAAVSVPITSVPITQLPAPTKTATNDLASKVPMPISDPNKPSDTIAHFKKVDSQHPKHKIKTSYSYYARSKQEHSRLHNGHRQHRHSHLHQFKNLRGFYKLIDTYKYTSNPETGLWARFLPRAGYDQFEFLSVLINL